MNSEIRSFVFNLKNKQIDLESKMIGINGNMLSIGRQALERNVLDAIEEYYEIKGSLKEINYLIRVLEDWMDKRMKEYLIIQ